jgi:hypothetical protein
MQAANSGVLQEAPELPAEKEPNLLRERTLPQAQFPQQAVLPHSQSAGIQQAALQMIQ